MQNMWYTSSSSVTIHGYFPSPTNFCILSKENEDTSGSLRDPFSDVVHDSDNKQKRVKQMKHPAKSNLAAF